MNRKKRPFPVAHSRTFYRSVGGLAVASLLATVPAAGAWAAPGGELDAGFGDNGRLMIPEVGFGGAIARQPDGKLLVAGKHGTGSAANPVFAVFRLHPDGSPDDTFGTNGRAVLNVGGTGSIATELALQPDGRIIVAGESVSFEQDIDLALARFNPDGTVDATFGEDGMVRPGLGGYYESIQGLLLLQNGQFVITGSTTVNGDADLFFARLNADGGLDTTFGTGPVAGTTLVDTEDVNGNPTYEWSSWITRQPDGKYVACGASETLELVSNAVMLAVRINPDGSVDTAYGNNGVSLTYAGETFSAATACVAMADGTVVLAGYRGNPGEVDLALVRLASDGLPDVTFGNSGIVSIDLGDVAWAQALIQLGDGNLGLTGSAMQRNAAGELLQGDMFFARVSPDRGLLDTGFGNDGVTIVDFGFANQSAWSDGLAIIEQADGKLVAAGNTAESRMALARVDPAGTGSAGFAGFVETAANAVEGAELIVSVRRTGGSTGELTVQYDTVAGTATAPGDFTPSFGTLNWASGDVDSKSIRVPTTDDGIDESNEAFSIVLSNANGGLAASEFGATITNAVTPTPPPPPPASPPPAPSSGSSGGGGMGMEVMMLLAMALCFRRALDNRSLPAPS
jgi:uncharacterized delta-60 repeat protein